MTTEDLIRALVADRFVGQRPRVALLLALVPAIAVVATLFFSWIGFRDDIEAALQTVRFLFKFVVIAPLAALSFVTLLRSTDPTSQSGWWETVLPLPLILLLIGVAAELLSIPRTAAFARLIGSNAANCMMLIPGLACAPLALFIMALKNSAPANPGSAGALAGLAAGSLAANFYAANCFDDSPLFVIVWYPLAIGFVVLTGYVAGRVTLRW
jgi:hypothetical protein